MNITAINVFIEVDGEQCMAVIDGTRVEMFMGMLPAFQSKGAARAELVRLPAEVADRLIETRCALLGAFSAAAKKGSAA